MIEETNCLSNSLIVAAHPDDEMLWFGAIIDRVDRVFIVFEDYWPDPEMGPARAQAVKNYPRDNVINLKIAEAATHGCASWELPELSAYGMKLDLISDVRDAKQTVKKIVGKGKAPKQGIRAHYEENFRTLVTAMRPHLTPDTNVFTHNPWGEYGHEDHVLVFRALQKLRLEIGFNLWISNYCTERALSLAMTYFQTSESETIQLPVNKEFCDSVAQVYRDAGCWTWSDDWVWFDTETYMKAPEGQVFSKAQGHLFPLNFFNIEAIPKPNVALDEHEIVA